MALRYSLRADSLPMIISTMPLSSSTEMSGFSAADLSSAKGSDR